jgi:hypothetical protein
MIVPDMAQIGRDFDEASSFLHDLAEQGISVRTA